MKPCEDKNSNICVAEGCYGEACMAQIRNIPVLSDVHRDIIVGVASIKDDTITITVKNEELVNIAEQLTTVDQLRYFILGFGYSLPKGKA